MRLNADLTGEVKLLINPELRKRKSAREIAKEFGNYNWRSMKTLLSRSINNNNKMQEQQLQ